MDRLAAMEVFVRVVEAGSFSAVAREKSTTQSAISKQIAALEDRLGTKLLNRSTRSLSLTEDGARYVDEARRLVTEFEAAEDMVRQGQGQLSGWLRVAASVGYGRLVLLPVIKQFLALHPNVKIDLKLHDGFIDLIEQGIDVAIRIGDLPDSSLVASRIGRSRRILLAAAHYAADIGGSLPALNAPADLRQHNCVVYTELQTQNNWEFIGPNGDLETVRVSGNLQTNSSEAIRASGRAGIGICFAPHWLFAAEIESGEVVPLLPTWLGRPIPIHAVSPLHRRHVRKIQAFVDHLSRSQ